MLARQGKDPFPTTQAALLFLCLAALGVACKPELPGFSCDNDAQCSAVGPSPRCEPTRACSAADASCGSGRRYGAYSVPALRNQCVGASDGGAGGDAGANVFADEFVWQGLHGATLTGGNATTVWWNPDAWDVTGNTNFNALEFTGFHGAVHRSSGDLLRADVLDDRAVLGGDGSPGVGVLRIDFRGVVSARLRAPAHIAQSEPLEISMHTARVASATHGWEVAITPALVAGHQTALAEMGPTHPFDSVNVGLYGGGAYPCPNLWGSNRIELRKALGGVVEAHDGKAIAIEPTRLEELVPFVLRFYPDHVDVLGDYDGVGGPELLSSFPVTVPWADVYVHIIGVANGAGGVDGRGFPADDTCGNYFKTTLRDLPFKHLRIAPVSLRSAAFPRQQGSARTARELGFLFFDLRDIQNFGVASGVAQPNPTAYDKLGSLFCSGGGGCGAPSATQLRTLTLPADAVAGLTQARLVCDVRGTGAAAVAVNGNGAIDLPNWRSIAPVDDELWVRGSVAIPTGQLKAGDNALRFELSGAVQLDRLELETAR